MLKMLFAICFQCRSAALGRLLIRSQIDRILSLPQTVALSRHRWARWRLTIHSCSPTPHQRGARRRRQQPQPLPQLHLSLVVPPVGFHLARWVNVLVSTEYSYVKIIFFKALTYLQTSEAVSPSSTNFGLDKVIPTMPSSCRPRIWCAVALAPTSVVPLARRWSSQQASLQSISMRCHVVCPPWRRAAAQHPGRRPSRKSSAESRPSRAPGLGSLYLATTLSLAHHSSVAALWSRPDMWSQQPIAFWRNCE